MRGVAVVVVGLEQQRDAPDARKANGCEDNPGQQCGLPAADPGHEVKAEQTDAAPVQSADNGQRQGKFIQKH